MSERINQFLADKATVLVEESFTGVRAGWWWERRLDGGIVVCQELDPDAMSHELFAATGRDLREVRQAVERELGLDDAEPVVLTFEIPGATPAGEAHRLLRERSSSPEGLAASLYQRIEADLGGDS
jgi:hypothetical protein